MTTGGVVVDHAAIAAIVRNPDGPVVAAFYALVRCVEGTAKRNAVADTGLLRASIHSEVNLSGAEINGLVIADAPYAAFVESGTGIYGPTGQPIRPKNGKFLVFETSEGTVFAKEVSGRRATPFMAPALSECLGGLGG